MKKLYIIGGIVFALIVCGLIGIIVWMNSQSSGRESSSNRPVTVNYGKVDAKTGARSSVVGGLDEIQGTLEGIQGTINDIRSRQNSLESDNKYLKSAYETEIKNSKLSSEARFEKIGRSVEALTKSISEYQSRVVSRVDTMDTRMKAFEQKYIAAQVELDKMGKRYFLMQKELENVGKEIKYEITSEASTGIEGLRMNRANSRDSVEIPQEVKTVDGLDLKKIDNRMTYAVSDNAMRFENEMVATKLIMWDGGTTDPSLIAKPKSKFEIKTPVVTIPAGSMVKAKLVFGAHAPLTGEPAPMIFKLLDIIRGPSRSSVPLGEAIMIGKAKANVSASRADVQVVGISGVSPIGQAYSHKMNGYVVGGDAQAGISGKLIDLPPGAFLKTGFVGFLAAGADALRGATVSSQTDGYGGTTQNVIPGQEAKNAAYTGLADAFGKIGDVFSKRMSEHITVVEVKPNQEVVVVVLEPIVLEVVEYDMFSNKATFNEGIK